MTIYPVTEHDVREWLGTAADDYTPEQVERFCEIAETYRAEIEAARPGYGTDEYEAADYLEEDTAAWVAILEIIDGTLSLEARARAYREARDAQRAAAIIAVLSGEVPEYEAAPRAGLARGTLRKLLHKTTL